MNVVEGTRINLVPWRRLNGDLTHWTKQPFSTPNARERHSTFRDEGQ